MRVFLAIAVFFASIGAFSLAYAQDEAQLCAPPQPTKISIKPETKDIKYDYSLTLAQMQKQSSDTVNPYGFHQHTETRGLMRGLVKIDTPNVKLGMRRVGRKGEYVCAWFDAVNIKIKIDPTIMIAKEVAADPCMHKVVREHEQQHVKIDRQLVNEYAHIIGNALNKALYKKGYSGGPVPEEELSDLQNSMSDLVGNVLVQQHTNMMTERAKRQQALDSLDEYKRITAQCPGFSHAHR